MTIAFDWYAKPQQTNKQTNKQINIQTNQYRWDNVTQKDKNKSSYDKSDYSRLIRLYALLLQFSVIIKCTMYRLSKSESQRIALSDIRLFVPMFHDSSRKL